MSTERPLQTRRDFDPDQPYTGRVPDHVPEYTERTDTFDDTAENNQDRHHVSRIKKIGIAVVATAAITIGAITGKNVLATNHSPEAGRADNTPTATGPAVPGPTHESQPAAPAYDPNNYKTWTADHVPLVVNGPDGKVDSYDSVQAYSEALLIPGASPEEISKNPQQYAEQLLAAINSYLTAVDNPQAASKYENVPPTDANSYTGIGAVLDQYVKPGFEKAIVGEPEKGASTLGTDNTQEWLDTLNKTAHNISHFKIVTQGQYKGQWELSPSDSNQSVGYTTYDTNAGTIHIYMKVNFVDNMDQTSLAGQQNADGSTVQSLDTAEVWNMEVQQQTVDGKPALRIVSISADKQSMQQTEQ